MLDDLDKVNSKIFIRYEELTEKPVSTIKKIYEFLDMTPYNLPEKDAEWKIHEKNLPIKNMNQDSYNRLSDEDFETIKSEAGILLEEFGYVRQGVI